MADFGFTSEATSTTLRIAISAKGTQGYRAPELLESEGGVFTSRADIWSMGCILYELAIGKRAFSDDLATLRYKTSSSSLNIVLDEDFSSKCKESITENIVRMLKVDFLSRPSAAILLESFSFNFQSMQVHPPNPVRIHQIFSESHRAIIDPLTSGLQGIYALAGMRLTSVIDLSLKSSQADSPPASTDFHASASSSKTTTLMTRPTVEHLHSSDASSPVSYYDDALTTTRNSISPSVDNPIELQMTPTQYSLGANRREFVTRPHQMTMEAPQTNPKESSYLEEEVAVV